MICNTAKPNRIYSKIAFVGLIFSLYGPKLFGFVDLMNLVPFFLLVFVLLLRNNDLSILRLDSFCFFLLIQVLLILIYVILVFILTPFGDLFFVLRTFRAFLSAQILFLLFYGIFRYNLVDVGVFIGMLMFVFFIGSIVVFVQAFFPDTQIWFAELWGFDKSHRFLRAFGMTAGYDTMGYLLVFGACGALLRYFRFNGKENLFYFVFIGAAIFLTSRTSMVLFVGLSFCIFVFSLKFNELISLKSVFVLLLLFVAIYFFVYPLILYTIVLKDSSAEIFGFSLSDRFAVTDIDDVFRHHYVLPDSLGGLVFGAGIDYSVDPGYTTIIFYGGLFLLFLYILFYSSLFILLRVKAKYCLYKISSANSPLHYNELLSIFFVFTLVKLFLIITVVGNLKNLYFFTRGYHELLIILVAVFLGSFSRLREAAAQNKTLFPVKTD